MTVNGAYKHLRYCGIESDYFVMMDSREDNVCHVDAPGDDTLHLLASQCAPVVFNALLDHRVMLFHPGTETVNEVVPKGTDMIAAPIGMASIYAIYIALALGHRRLLLFGYDFSHVGQERYAFAQHMNEGEDIIEISLDGKVYRTTTALARTADVFVQCVKPMVDHCGAQISLCSNGGLLAAMIDHAKNRPTADSEKQKYEAMWTIAPYRKIAPALEYVQDAYDRLGMEPGDSLLDLGAGTGRASAWFADRGLRVTAVDIADNALETEDIPFACQPLWDPLPEADYGFSCDVLEHLPPEYVRLALKRIHDACRACYLNIDTVPDSFGVNIGQRLHLTVMTAADWEYELKAVWPQVETVETTDKQAIFICRRD